MCSDINKTWSCERQNALDHWRNNFFQDIVNKGTFIKEEYLKEKEGACVLQTGKQGSHHNLTGFMRKDGARLYLGVYEGRSGWEQKKWDYFITSSIF